MIKDELTSFIYFKKPKIYISEYIPFGSNHIIAFNEQLDCQRDVKEGLLTSFIDTEPTKATFKIEEDLTRVQIVDHDPNDYVEFNASIVYEEVVEQEEEIAVYVDAYGRVIYATEILEIDSANSILSLDKMTRIISDLILDSSKMINTLLSTYQRRLLDLVYFGTPEYRNKFTILLVDEIEPDKEAQYFNDGEDLENELNQILSSTTDFHDMTSSGDKIFYGLEGVIIISQDPEKYEDIIPILTFYLGLDIFQKNYFSKMFMLWDDIKEARKLMDHADIDPMATNQAKEILSSVSASVVLMNEILAFMRKSVENMNEEWENLDKSNTDIQELIELIKLDDIIGKALIRIDDAHLVVSGLTEEISGVNGLINSLAEKQMSRLNESFRDSIASLDEMGRASERTGVALNILEIVLSGAIAFDVLAFLVGDYAFDALAIWLAEDYHIWIWFAISLALFFAIGFGLYRVIKYLEVKAEPNLRAKIAVSKPLRMSRFKEFLDTKDIIIRESNVADNIIEEFCWDEDDKKWLGNEVRIKLRADTENYFLLSVLINIDSPNNITARQIADIVMNYLNDEEII
jgi:WD repeat-containing protein 35